MRARTLAASGVSAISSSVTTLSLSSPMMTTGASVSPTSLGRRTMASGCASTVASEVAKTGCQRREDAENVVATVVATSVVGRIEVARALVLPFRPTPR